MIHILFKILYVLLADYLDFIIEIIAIIYPFMIEVSCFQILDNHSSIPV